MTPEEYNAWLKALVDAMPMATPRAWVLVEAESIEHPSVVGYFDHLYAQELGIVYP